MAPKAEIGGSFWIIRTGSKSGALVTVTLSCRDMFFRNNMPRGTSDRLKNTSGLPGFYSYGYHLLKPPYDGDDHDLRSLNLETWEFSNKPGDLSGT